MERRKPIKNPLKTTQNHQRDKTRQRKYHDELRKAFIYVAWLWYSKLLKTELRILDFQHFHWLAGHRLSAHIPALPNMVNESIKKESWIKKFPRNWRPLKIV